MSNIFNSTKYDFESFGCHLENLAHEINDLANNMKDHIIEDSTFFSKEDVLLLESTSESLDAAKWKIANLEKENAYLKKQTEEQQKKIQALDSSNRHLLSQTTNFRPF